MNLSERAQELHQLIDSLSPEFLKEKLLRAHHLALLEKIIVNVNNPQSLEKVLADNWHQFKGTLCSYTAQPESEVTLLLCDIATYLSGETGKKPIKLLMPGVSTKSVLDDYPSLNKLDVKTVLRTHVLSESGNYLYPMRSLSALQCEKDLDAQNIPNPYFDYMQGPDNEAYIPTPALWRMLNHSRETQALWDAKTHYLSLIGETHLLGQLHLLIKTLRMNSTSGIGTEMQAGTRAYAGIISFNDYYQTLSEEQRDAIPQEVRDEITLLLTLSEDKDENRIGTENTETCLNTRQSRLAAAVNKHEQALMAITTDGDTKSRMLEAARKSFETCQSQINTQCEEGSYQGCDKLKISKELIQTLQVPLTLSNEADLEGFISLTPEDIESLLENNEALQNQLTQILADLENLILFTISVPIEQLQTILHFIAQHLPRPTAKEFSAWLEMLDIKRFEIVFNAFKEKVIITPHDFRQTLNQLSEEKRTAVIEALKNRLPSLIKDAGEFFLVLEPLSTEQRTVVLEALKDRLPSLIKSAGDFRFLLKDLNAEQRAVVLEALKDTLPSLIKSARDLWLVLLPLSTEQRAEVFEVLKDRLPSLIQSAGDFWLVLRPLSTEQRAVVLEALKETLPSLIKDADDFIKVLQLLSDEQSGIVFEALKDTLPSLIKDARDFYNVFNFLSTEERAVVFEALKDTLPSLIKDAFGFQRVLEYLNAEQRAVVFEALKDTLLKLFPSAEDIEALRSLNDAQKAVLLDTFNRHQLSTLAVIPDNPPTLLLSSKHSLEEAQDEPAKRRRVGRREMAVLGVNPLEDQESPRKRNMPPTNNAKRQRN